MTTDVDGDVFLQRSSGGSGGNIGTLIIGDDVAGRITVPGQVETLVRAVTVETTGFVEVSAASGRMTAMPASGVC